MPYKGRIERKLTAIKQTMASLMVRRPETNEEGSYSMSRLFFVFFFFLFSNGICLKSNNTVKCVLSVIGNVHFEFGASFSRRFAFGSTIEFRLALIRDEIIVRPSHVNSFVFCFFFCVEMKSEEIYYFLSSNF